MAESEEELKSFLMKVKEESEKGGLKLNIQKTKIIASGSIQIRSFTQSCPTLCDPMNRSTPGFTNSHQLSITTSRSSLRLTSIESAMSASPHMPLAVAPQASPSPLWGRRQAGQPGLQRPVQPTAAFLEQGVLWEAGPGIALRAEGWGTRVG